MRRWKCPECGRRMGANWRSRHVCGEDFTIRRKEKKEPHIVEVFVQELGEPPQQQYIGNDYEFAVEIMANNTAEFKDQIYAGCIRVFMTIEGMVRR